MHHMRQWGMTFQIAPASDFPNLSDQHDSKSTTPLGITQAIPNKAKINDQSSCATMQCRSRWLTDSPWALHMQHQSIMITLRFLRLSTVRILSKAVVQVKKSHSGRHLWLPYTFPKEKRIEMAVIDESNKTLLWRPFDLKASNTSHLSSPYKWDMNRGAPWKQTVSPIPNPKLA